MIRTGGRNSAPVILMLLLPEEITQSFPGRIPMPRQAGGGNCPPTTVTEAPPSLHDSALRAFTGRDWDMGWVAVDKFTSP